MPMPGVHAAISTPLAVSIWLATGSPPAAALAWCAGVLVDADHLLDSWLDLRRLEWHPRALVAAIKASGRLYLPLHAAEWLAAFVLMAVAAPSPAAVGLLAGYGLHMGLDLAFNRVPAPLYVLSYRAWRGFSCSWKV